MTLKTIPTPDLNSFPEHRIKFIGLLQEEPVSGCILWTGAETAEGYGSFGIMGRTYLVHRLSWVLGHGEQPPAGVRIRHLCRNKRCVAISHLTPE